MSSELPLSSRRNQHASGASGIVKRFIMMLLLLILLGGGAYGGYLYYKFDHMLDKTSAPDTGTTISAPPVKSKPVSILLLGLDTRNETGSLNTDVIMVATLNPEHKTATIVSIPRDTYMKPEGYRARKANAFYSIASRSEKDTETEIKRIFGEFLEIPIDYVSVVYFKTFEDIIDHLGGVMIDVDIDMRYVDHADGTNIDLRKGYQELDGKQALDFVRYRQSNRGTAPSSDFERNGRQQQMISAVVDELKSFTTPLKIGGIFDAIGDNLKTDIPKDEIKSLIWTYKGIGNDNIEYIPLPAEWRSPYSYVDPEHLAEAKQKLRLQLQ